MTNSTTATPAAAKLREAVLRHRAGKLEEASALYAEALALDPAMPDALHLQGLLAHQQGRHAEALAPISAAIERAPTVPDFRYSRGVVRRTVGDLAGAEADFEAVTGLNPRHVEAWVNLGVLRLQRRDPQAALDAFTRAAALAPDAAEVQGYLGTAQLQLGALDPAIEALQRATALAPEFSEAHYNLGIALERRGDAARAEAAWRRAIETNPYYLKPWARLGGLLEKQGRAAEARAFYERALTHAASDARDAAPIWNNLGNILDAAGDVPGAVNAFERAVALAPDDARTRVNLGTAYLGVGFVDRAREHFATARRRDPQLSAAAHCDLLALLYGAEDGAASLAAAQAWAARVPAPPSEPHTNARDPERRLRIGYVSPDFVQHVVAAFSEPVLAAHDRQAVELFCYAEVKRPDAATERFRRLADHWRDTVGMDDADLARTIRADGIDILVDLAGHTLDSRIEAFALKPAPIQMTWIGYPATTGLTQIDWRITDALADPPGMTEAHYTEKLLRLPGFNCYQPPEDAPPVAPPPSATRGFVTFGSFNHAAKIGDAAIALWAALLARVPGSRLLIKHRGLLYPPARAACRAAFERHGIGAERLELVDHVTGFKEHLALYGRVDIALDTVPYNGTTTTCEALWMGVPVIALAGSTHHARVGVSLLSRLGLTELVGGSREAYVEIAAKLAGDRARLANLRAGLRARMAGSPLCDAAQVARDLEAAYRSLWRAWCGSA